MKSMGWEEGEGLGKDKQGIKGYVRVKNKQDTTDEAAILSNGDVQIEKEDNGGDTENNGVAITEAEPTGLIIEEELQVNAFVEELSKPLRKEEAESLAMAIEASSKAVIDRMREIMTNNKRELEKMMKREEKKKQKREEKKKQKIDEMQKKEEKRLNKNKKKKK